MGCELKLQTPSAQNLFSLRHQNRCVLTLSLHWLSSFSELTPQGLTHPSGQPNGKVQNIQTSSQKEYKKKSPSFSFFSFRPEFLDSGGKSFWVLLLPLGFELEASMHDLGLDREADNGSEKRVCLLLNPSPSSATSTNDVVFCWWVC